MHSFTITITQDANSLLSYLKTEVESNEGIFIGNECSGTFSGKGIEGMYEVLEDCLTITITKKPFIIPMKMIENEIRKYFPK